jgi:hypothetical protein
MRRITVTSYNGQKFEGDWNEKVYPSKIQGKPELHRIYVNNTEIHITDEELQKITNDIQNSKEANEEANMRMIIKLFEGLADDNKRRIVNALMKKYIETKDIDKQMDLYVMLDKWVEITKQT